ncbi:MAG: fused response regulator/phosphatase [Clostridiales bacterium]|nr:fused response regulator/phosphatase [Clostridiales bacterium]
MYKILIVDDNPATLLAVTTYLSLHDYTVYSSTTCSNALTKIPRIQPNLIAAASHLPDMSGFDFCRTIKSDLEYKDILVLMIIDTTYPGEEEKALYANSDDYLTRGFTGKMLLSKLRSLFRINDLNTSLKNRYAELEEANKYLELQIQMAMKVQRSIIKDVDMTYKNIRVKTKYLPALAIGGDFFNVRVIDKNRFGIIIGDVSGHGISASLLTIMLSQVFVSFCHDIDMPSTLLRKMNEAFYSVFEDSDSDMYACVFYAIIDINKGVVTYSNSGESYPILISENGKKSMELEVDGIPVGMLKDVSYVDKSFEYKEGDVLFFHTDGLGDFYYKNDNSFFMEKLRYSLMETVKTHDKVEDIMTLTLNTFYNEKDSHKYKNDDVSVIVAKL